MGTLRGLAALPLTEDTWTLSLWSHPGGLGYGGKSSLSTERQSCPWASSVLSIHSSKEANALDNPCREIMHSECALVKTSATETANYIGPPGAVLGV